MQKNQNKKKAGKASAPADVEAYTNAQQLLKDLKKGYVPYDKIFTSSGEALAAFPRLISGDLFI